MGKSYYCIEAMVNGKIKYIASQNPPRGLFTTIIKRLGLEKSLRVTKKHLIFTSIVFIVACVALVFAINFLKHELAESEFSPFALLFFSDTSFVLSHSRDFILAFLESIPAVRITIVLGTVILLLVVLKLVVQYTDKISQLLKSIHKKKHEFR